MRTRHSRSRQLVLYPFASSILLPAAPIPQAKARFWIKGHNENSYQFILQESYRKVAILPLDLGELDLHCSTRSKLPLAKDHTRL